MKSRKPGNEQSPFCRPGCPPSARAKTVMNVPFDHLYACHTDQSTQLRYLGGASPAARRIHPVTERTLTERLNQCSKENRMLKNLLLVNLDLVQQQSDRIACKDQAIAAFKNENAALRLRLDRFNRRIALQRAVLNPPPLVPVNVPASPPPPPPPAVRPASKPPTAQVSLNKYSELLITDNCSQKTADSNLNDVRNSLHNPDRGELLHLPNADSIVKDEPEESKEQNNYLLPKDFPDFLKSEMSSLLEENDDDLTKQKSSLFSADDEFLLPEIDVTSVDTEADANKSKALAGNDLLDFLNIPEMTAADRLKESICRQKSSSTDPGRRSSVKKESSRSSSSRSRSSRSHHGKSHGSKSRSHSSRAKHPATAKTSTTRSKNETITYSQFYKSRNTLKVECSETETSPEVAKIFDNTFTVNKKSKMIHTYSKSSKSVALTTAADVATAATRDPAYTGSLSDRLKLIDTTPTGEDPYQLGEADMREQSPIPKLMLQKNNPNKIKLFSGENFTCTSEAMQSLFDSSVIGENEDGKAITKIKLTYNLGADDIIDKNNEDAENNHMSVAESEMLKEKMEVSCYDFSYGENSQNVAPPNFDNDFSALFSTSAHSPSDALDQDYLLSEVAEEDNDNNASASNVDTSRSVSLHKPKPETGTDCIPKTKIKEKSKRTLSTCSSHKSETGESGDAASNIFVDIKGKGKPVPSATITRPPRKRSTTVNGAIAKKTTFPPLTVRRPYHTTLGDTESSWYMGPGLDADERELHSTSEPTQESVEVPRWREKTYTGCYSMEGTENLDDEIFHKRHHKREQDEKRRKRWDIQGIREQMVVERLRRKQRDAPWYNRPSAEAEAQPPHTLLPQPRRDLQFIEIVDEIPVSAFGENVPALPKSDFYLPWVRSSKPQKRVKRAKRPKEEVEAKEEKKEEPVQENKQPNPVQLGRVRTAPKFPRLRHKLHKIRSSELSKFRAMLNSARGYGSSKILKN